jgi:putative redox protein
MAFEAKDSLGHTVIMDAGEKFGGQSSGFLPKPLLLASLAGCMGIDVINVLNKMRIEVESFDIDISGEMNEEQPRYYHKIHLVYKFKGAELPMDKLERAVQLSKDQYCNVSALLSKGAEITHEILILD